MSETQVLPIELTDINGNTAYLNATQIISAYIVNSASEAAEHVLKKELYPCTYVRMNDSCYVFVQETPKEIRKIVMATPLEMLEVMQGKISDLVGSF